jgi:hypothetical protein
MISKKEVIKKEIDFMVSIYPIVTWFQLTQKSTKNWNEIYVNIEKDLKAYNPGMDDYKYFQVKSKLLELGLKSNQKANQDYVCQGRLLIYGCKTPELLNSFIKTLEKEQGGFMIGGLYGDQLRNYRELGKLQSLDKTTYVSSIPVLNLLSIRLTSIKNICDFSYLNNPYFKLYYLLQEIKKRAE